VRHHINDSEFAESGNPHAAHRIADEVQEAKRFRFKGKDKGLAISQWMLNQ
jgi:hypothetical protein